MEEQWRRVWREGFAPILSINALRKLRDALATDDPRLCQGLTTKPGALMCDADETPVAACALGFCGWQDDPEGCATVGKVEEFFALKCFQADETLGEPAACRWFLNWFDDTPRAEVARELIPEIDRELSRRGAVAVETVADESRTFDVGGES